MRATTVIGRAAAALLLTAAAALTSAPLAAAELRDITLTLVRHAQSAGNASGLIDSSTPGPVLTDLGRHEAEAITTELRGKGTVYNGIYASTMVRTQQTAEPMAVALREPVVVLPGLREIEAGDYEGLPEADAATTYAAAPLRWISGDRAARIPGSIDGNEFDARYDEAVQRIYDSGDTNAVAYSHGAAIMMWVAMNVRGADPATFLTEPLQNTGYIVIRGNPVEGWDLVTSRTDP